MLLKSYTVISHKQYLQKVRERAREPYGKRQFSRREIYGIYFEFRIENEIYCFIPFTPSIPSRDVVISFFSCF